MHLLWFLEHTMVWIHMLKEKELSSLNSQMQQESTLPAEMSLRSHTPLMELPKLL